MKSCSEGHLCVHRIIHTVISVSVGIVTLAVIVSNLKKMLSLWRSIGKDEPA